MVHQCFLTSPFPQRFFTVAINFNFIHYLSRFSGVNNCQMRLIMCSSLNYKKTFFTLLERQGIASTS